MACWDSHLSYCVRFPWASCSFHCTGKGLCFLFVMAISVLVILSLLTGKVPYQDVACSKFLKEQTFLFTFLPFTASDNITLHNEMQSANSFLTSMPCVLLSIEACKKIPC